MKHRTMHEWSFKIVGGSDELVLCAVIDGAKTEFVLARRNKDIVGTGIPLTLEHLELLGQTVSTVLTKFRPAPPAPPPPKPPAPKPPVVADEDDPLGDLTPGLYNILTSRGITTLDALATYTAVDLLKIPRLGRGRLREVDALLKKHGFRREK